MLLLLCFLGFVLIRHLSWFCDDQSDLRYPALLPGLPLDPAYACLLACECPSDSIIDTNLLSQLVLFVFVLQWM